MRWSSPRLGTFGLAVSAGALVLVACSAGTEPGPQTATLHILSGSVEVQGAGDPASPAVDGETLAGGDVVRTGADGRAAIEYFDGSITRLDHDTAFAISDLLLLDDAAGSSLIHTEQSSGDTFHRLAALTASGSRFDVVTPIATAAVRGTTFAVIFNGDGSVTFAVLEGTVTLETPEGLITVVASFMVTAPPDGATVGPVPIPESLLHEEWIFFNRCVLDGVGECRLAALDHILLSPAESTITAGVVQAYTVEGFAADGTSLGDVTSAAVISGEGCVATACAPLVAGEHEITATIAGRRTAATLVVEPGGVHELVISPEAATVEAGVPQRLVVEGFDAQGNSVGPVAATLTMSAGFCSAGSCTSTVVGEHSVNAFFAGIVAHTTTEVVAGPLASIMVSPAEATVLAGEAQSYFALGFDAYGNVLGPVAATFSISDGTCTGGSCVAATAGIHTVLAGFGGVTESAVLTVLTGPAAAISLTAIDPYSPPLTIDCTGVLFRATIVDEYGNVVDDDTSVVQFVHSGAGNPVFPNGGGVVVSNGVAEITVTYGYPYGASSVQATLETIVSNTIPVQVSYCIG